MTIITTTNFSCDEGYKENTLQCIKCERYNPIRFYLCGLKTIGRRVGKRKQDTDTLSDDNLTINKKKMQDEEKTEEQGEEQTETPETPPTEETPA